MNKALLGAEKFNSSGFSLLELLVAMTIMLIVLAAAFLIFDQLNNVSATVASIATVNENMRVAANLIARDLTSAGANVPQGGIPLPYGGSAKPITRPGPGAFTFPSYSGTAFMSAITTGEGLGPPSGAIRSDEITMVWVDSSSTLDDFPLTSVSFSPSSSATVTVNTSTLGGVGQVSPGQLIMLTNANGSCLLTATSVDPSSSTITFTQGDPNDVLGLNQFNSDITSGSIAQLQTPGTPPTFPTTTAYAIKMVSYYLKEASPQEQLVQQLGDGTPQVVALGVDKLQFSYDLSDGVTLDQPTILSPNTPNDIAKVNMIVEAQAEHPSRKTGQYFSDTIDTSITIQNLAFRNKYPSAP